MLSGPSVNPKLVDATRAGPASPFEVQMSCSDDLSHLRAASFAFVTGVIVVDAAAND